jgi:imidazoleglycerol-phosphate dehydratase / histidinol-phosphatase
MGTRKIVFVDRDGTLIEEPPTHQIDSIEKLQLVCDVIPALLVLRDAGYAFVMVTNQDGLGTPSFTQEQFDGAHQMMLEIFRSQGIEFADVLICPHLPGDGCTCRKPQLGLVRSYLTSDLDLARSAMVGDRDADVLLAKNMGIRGFRVGRKAADAIAWPEVARQLLDTPRRARVERNTRETQVAIEVDLDGGGATEISTGIGFFDHLLAQIAKHSGVALRVRVSGDLQVDTHHTVEDTALVLGAALRQALGDKVGIERYGFVCPMDDAETRVSLDLSGRPYLVFEAKFASEKVGELPTEMVPHFYRSLCESLGATMHMHVYGENAHHMVESSAKALARALRQAVARTGTGLPSTKGAL